MATQCTPIINDSALLSAAQYRTKNKLTTVTFVDILKIIRSLNVKKVNGHDLMLIRMLTTCDAEVKKLLSLKLVFNVGVFWNLCKKSDTVSVHKKGGEQFVVNYCPFSLLSICCKVYKELHLTKFSSFFKKANYQRTQKINCWQF